MTHVEWSILCPAFMAGLLVLSTHVPLGIEVLKRGIIFIDLAIAQTAGLGALAAMLCWSDATEGRHEFMIQGCSLAAALLGALLLTWAEKRLPEIQEALIGCMFVLAASLALLLVGQNPHGAEHMKDLLAGQILWVSFHQLIGIALLYTVLLVAWFAFKTRMGRSGFYVIFALAVTASVQLVGVYLVFANLIMPSLAVRKCGRPIMAGYCTGAAGLAAGLILSSILDYATGPTIVCTLATVSTLTLIITSKTKG